MINVKNETGERSFPIWLLLNPKHPGVLHNIWTPILDIIQDKVYRAIETRIDTTNLYIRNAINDCGKVPNTLNWWANEVNREIELFGENILEYNPKILISFGAFPFEFVRRSFKSKPEKGPKYWSNSNLISEFEQSIKDFNLDTTNRIPLLRQMGTANNLEMNNYFQLIGTNLAEKIIENKNGLDIWIK